MTYDLSQIAMHLDLRPDVPPGHAAATPQNRRPPMPASSLGNRTSKPERLEDIAFDYEPFRREMHDIVSERRVDSERHAGPFVRRSMNNERAPLVLTRAHRRLALPARLA
jgi:hypothetical protein